MFRGSVKSTGYPLHSPVSYSVALPRVAVCHHISTAVYEPTVRICPQRGPMGNTRAAGRLNRSASERSEGGNSYAVAGPSS